MTLFFSGTEKGKTGGDWSLRLHLGLTIVEALVFEESPRETKRGPLSICKAGSVWLESELHTNPTRGIMVKKLEGINNGHESYPLRITP